jgi:hypothetical protein
MGNQTATRPPVFLFKWGSLCQLFDSLGSPGTGQGCVDPDGGGPLHFGDGQFQQPGNLAFDSQGNVYVMDAGNHRIQKFDRAGHFLTKWGTFCDLNGEAGVVGRGCVDPDGGGPLESGDGQFFLNLLGGAGIATDSQDHVYVVDQGNNRVQVFDRHGTFLRKWGSKCPSRFGPCDGFSGPRGMAIDGHDFVYVYDGGLNSGDPFDTVDRVQKFDTNGNRVLKFQLCGPYTGNTCNTPNEITPLNGYALATDANNNVYVLRQFSSVAKFDSNGNRIGYLSIGAQSLTAYAIAVDSRAQVYLRGIQSDSGFVRVFKNFGQFTPPELLFQFAQGSGPGDLQEGDAGIALHPHSENVYLSDNAFSFQNNTITYLPEIKVWGATPQNAIAFLIDLVNALVGTGDLNRGQGTSLIAKLNATLQQLELDGANTAINLLQAFINQVNALITGRVLTAVEGQPLIDAANSIIQALTAGS